MNGGPPQNTRYDAVVIGAGMAGASLAYILADTMRVAVLEAEHVAGYHATGRSAAFWTESYGGPDIQPLTSASGPWLANPPAEFSATGFLHRRGALTIGKASDKGALDEEAEVFAARGVAMERLHGEAPGHHVPGLHPSWSEAIFEPDCCDIDVAALHQAYLAGANKRGADIRLNTPLKAADFSHGSWRITTPDAVLDAPLLINAAGAWADGVARIANVPPMGITPMRRTMVQLRMEQPVPDTLPLVIDHRGGFYFKPEHGALWLSPHDETPSAACDAAAEEWDVALAIERLQQAVDWRIAAAEHRWAGLRSFAPDRMPVYGHDGTQPGFFWFAGQGGYGIQTAPAAARIGAALITGDTLGSEDACIDCPQYAATRFAEQSVRSELTTAVSM